MQLQPMVHATSGVASRPPNWTGYISESMHKWVSFTSSSAIQLWVNLAIYSLSESRCTATSPLVGGEGPK